MHRRARPHLGRGSQAGGGAVAHQQARWRHWTASAPGRRPCSPCGTTASRWGCRPRRPRPACTTRTARTCRPPRRTGGPRHRRPSADALSSTSRWRAGTWACSHRSTRPPPAWRPCPLPSAGTHGTGLSGCCPRACARYWYGRNRISSAAFPPRLFRSCASASRTCRTASPSVISLVPCAQHTNSTGNRKVKHAPGLTPATLNTPRHAPRQ